MGEARGVTASAARYRSNARGQDSRSTALPSTSLGTGRAGLRFGRDDKKGQAAGFGDPALQNGKGRSNAKSPISPSSSLPSTTLPSTTLGTGGTGGTGRAGLRFGRDDKKGERGEGRVREYATEATQGAGWEPALPETATAGGRGHARPTERQRPKQREHARGRKGGIPFEFASLDYASLDYASLDYARDRRDRRDKRDRHGRPPLRSG